MKTIWKVRHTPRGVNSRDICPKCGSVLLIKPHKIERYDKVEAFKLFFNLYCPDCGYIKTGRFEVYEEELLFDGE